MSIACFLPLFWLLSISNALYPPCIPTLGDSATADDVPAINAALEECGNGGTVLLPESNTYQIASPINLSPCRGCTFQIDGDLNISTTDLGIWSSKEAVFQLSGTKDVIIKGKGLINGNDWKYFPVKENNFSRPPHIFNIVEANNIKVSGLRIRNAFGIGFNVQNSTDVELSSLVTTKEAPIANSVSAFEVMNSSHLKIHDVSITGPNACIAIRGNVTSADISRITCTGTAVYSDTGIAITSYPTGAKLQSNHNITFSDLSISNVQWATGIIATGGIVNATDITWRNVQVDGVYWAAIFVRCIGLVTACGSEPSPYLGALFNLERVLFTNFTGKAISQPKMLCFPVENGLCDWRVTEYEVTPRWIPPTLESRLGE